MTFWILWLTCGALISIAMLNPAPFIVAAVVAAVVKPSEDRTRAAVGSTGPKPTDGAGCIAWVGGGVLVAVLAFLCVAFAMMALGVEV